MKSTILLIAVLSLIALCSAWSNVFHQDFSAKYSNYTTSYSIPAFPARYRGLVNITVNAEVDLELCLQPYAALQSSFLSCTSGGYYTYKGSDNDNNVVVNAEPLFDISEENTFGQQEKRFNPLPVSQVYSALPKAEVEYYLSVRIPESDKSDGNNNTFVTLGLAYFNDTCPTGNVGLPDGSCTPTQTVSAGVPENVQLGNQSYHIFVLPVDNGQFYTYVNASVVITSNTTTEVRADADEASLQVLLRQNALPHVGNNDNITDGTAVLVNDNTYSVVIEDPLPGDWYLLVANENNATVTGSAVFQAGPVCGKGQYGPRCVELTADLTLQFNATEVNGTGDYQYFTVADLNLRVGTGLKDLSENAPALYASFLVAPTNTSFIGNSTGNDVNYLNLKADAQQDAVVWKIAVLAEENQTYYIWTNTDCPNDCTGSGNSNDTSKKGTCDVITGECDCDSGYNGLFCDKKSGLALIWIILIVIAVIIIVVVCIIVPIVYYMRNSQRARYERV